MVERISESAEYFLRSLDDEFWAELSNHAIGSDKVRYATAEDARLAMLRQAYLRGRADALPPFDPEAKIAEIEAHSR